MPERHAHALRLATILALVLLLAACSGPGASPSPSPSVVPTPTPTPQPLLAVVDAGATQNTLLLLTLNGQEEAQTLISKNAVIAGTTADEVAFENNSQLEALRTDGQVVTLGSMQGFKGGRVVLSPDGTQWMWSTYDRQSGDQVHSFIYLDDQLVADQVLADRFVEPVSWTTRGVVFEEADLGLTGYQPYDVVTGPTLLLQPQQQSAGNSPKGRQLTGSTCFYGDLAGDGSVLCRTPAATETSTSALQVTPVSGSAFNVTLPQPAFAEAGAISFLPAASQQGATTAPSEAVVGGATLSGASTGGQGETYGTAVLNLATRALVPLPTAGLRPGAGSWTWLSATELITYRPAGATGGAAGIYLASTSGPATLLWPQGTPVGLLDQSAASSTSPEPSPTGSSNPKTKV